MAVGSRDGALNRQLACNQTIEWRIGVFLIAIEPGGLYKLMIVRPEPLSRCQQCGSSTRAITSQKPRNRWSRGQEV